MRRRDLLGGSFAAVLSATLKVQAASLPPGFFSDDQIGRLRAVRVGVPVAVDDNAGDTWVAAWAGDGGLYSPSDDTRGFHRTATANVAFNRIDGSDPLHLSRSPNMFP